LDGDPILHLGVNWENLDFLKPMFYVIQGACMTCYRILSANKRHLPLSLMIHSGSRAILG
jgi:hypothetical protein